MKITFTLLAIVAVFSVAMCQSVAINADGSDPDGSAILDIKSTSKGLLIPRMTTAQRTAIVVPAIGLTVYQTDGTKGFYYYTGTTWSVLNDNGNSPWATSGTNLYTRNVGYNVGVGTTKPLAKLDVVTGNPVKVILEDTTNLNVGLTTAMYFKAKNYYYGGIKAIGTGTASGRLGLFTYGSPDSSQLVERLSITDGGFVGIGDTTPSYKLDVAGAIHSSGNAYFDGTVGIGTTSPNYKLEVDNGAIALYNQSDFKTWYMNYTTINGGYFYVAESGVNRLTIANGGNVGLGTAAPAVKLDVNGSGRYTGDLTVSGDLAVNDVAASGNVTANGGGVLYNTVSPVAANLKVYYRTAAFTVTGLTGHSLSAEGTVNIGGGFTVAPMVFVGDMTANAGEAGQTAGPLHVLQLQTYNSTTGSFNIRILNTSNSTVSQTVTWNIMCIGR